MTAPVDATTTSAWAELSSIRDSFTPDLRDWFAIDPRRAERLSFELADLHVDLSKNLVTDAILAALVRLAEETGVAERYAAMIAGEHINTTEDRAVLHTALRRPAGAQPALVVDGQDIDADVQSVLTAMTEFSTRVRVRRVDGRDRQEGHAHRQHRHRRLRPRSRHDLGGARALRDRRHRGALRLEHRPDRPRAEDEGPRPRDDAVHRRVQDVHDPRDPHQRAPRPRLALGRSRGVGCDRRRFDDSATSEDGCRRPPLRRRLDGARQGRRLRHRPRERLRVLGLGRRALLRRLGHRPVAHDRARPRRVPRAARRLPRGRRAHAHDPARARTCRC